MSKEIENALVEAKKAHEELKSKYDAALEGKLSESEFKEAEAKLNAAMDEAEKKNSEVIAEQKARIDSLESQIKENSGSGNAEEKADSKELQEYKSLGEEYLRTGNDSYLQEQKKIEDSSIEIKALVSNSDPQGGYLISFDPSGPIANRIYETSPMRQVATVRTTNAQYLQGPIRDNRSVAGWVGETDARPETNTATYGQYKIVPHELYANPVVSQIELEDSSVNPEELVLEDTMQEFMLLENEAFVIGDGVEKPRGFMAYPEAAAVGTYERGKVGTRTSSVSGTFNTDDLLTLSYDLISQYRANSAYAMSRSSIGLTRRLKDNDGQYLWQPSLIVGTPSTFNGIPVVEMNDIADVGADAKSVAIADWRRVYMIVDRVGISTLRDPYNSKPFVQFYSRKRVGGGLVQFDAIKILKCAS